MTKEIEKKIDAIYACLVTDPLDKNSEGLIDGFKRHEKEIKELQKNKAEKFKIWNLFKVFKVVKTIKSPL